ncbi:DUF4083 family protein [Metabacillus arenae]|uniref:DUF4083 family protein n=1 Tax=Metabacillus arenae TaxID=2771434 RepID=A0A926NSV3_9BACI|nr:DUF4083 family protein [Metabacillus arenae]MBD1383322.1 DUF4083 family protein [Metabacillus arenae]
MYNIGNILFQVISLVLLLGLVFAVYFAVRSIIIKPCNNLNSVEQKLDKIIELLERDKKS